MIRQAIGRLKTATKMTTRASRESYDAFDMLRADHMKAEGMLIRLRLMKGPKEREELFGRIRELLEIHMSIEEEIFYPACEKIPELKDLIDHGKTDHQLVKDALKSLGEMEPSSRMYDRLITKVIINAERHINDEEDDVFPVASGKMSKDELAELTRAMREAREAKESEKARQRAA